MSLTNLIGEEGYGRVVKGRHGYFLYNAHDIYVGRSMAVYGEYSEGEIDLFSQICAPGDTVVEAGANIGAHTVPLARIVGRQGAVCAFEPQRLVFQPLCANVALNSLENVRCYELALAAEGGHAHLPSVRYDADGNFGGVALSEEPTEHSLPVNKVTLDDFLHIPRMRLLKVDVEGMEADVLRGAARTIERTRPLVYVENHRPVAGEALVGLILDMGYRPYWHVVPLFNPKNHAGVTENLFPSINSISVLAVPVEIDARVVGFTPIADPADHPLREGLELRHLHSSVYHFSQESRPNAD